MTEDKIKKWFFFLGVLAFLCLSSLFLFIQNIPGHQDFDHLLMKQLTSSQSLAGISQGSMSESGRVIYVLGGSQNSLPPRFQTAAKLYRPDLCDKILILSSPGITEYSHLLDRNLTNDEWSVNNLVALGVKQINIEPVSFRKGFFGTLSEAKGVAGLAASRAYRHVYLVTSQYHIAPTWLTFSTAMKRQNIDLSISASTDDTDLPGHLLEYFKLMLYKYIVLPLYFSQLCVHNGSFAMRSNAVVVVLMNVRYVL